MNRVATNPIVLAFLLCLLASAVGAADIELAEGCGLAEAITAANSDSQAGECLAGSGDDSIILVDDISLSETLPTIASGITIEGAGYSIDGAGRRVFHVNADGNLALKNLSISGGGADENDQPCHEPVDDTEADDASDADEESAPLPIGGAICIDGGRLTVSHSQFADNVSLDHGGVIISIGGQIEIADSTFAGNSAVAGGAISVTDGSLIVMSSEFSGNQAGEHGGALYISGAGVEIIEADFSANQAAQYGGAIDNIAGGQLTLQAVTFDGNLATTGGAIGNWMSELLVIDSQFTANQAENGGAIQSEDGQQAICASQFSGDQASNFGSAVYIVRGSLSAADNTFQGQAAAEGGVVHIIEPEATELNLGGNSFAHNTSPDCVGCAGAGADLSACRPEDD